MTESNDNNIIGFFASFNFEENDQDLVKEFLWSDLGLKNRLITLKWSDCGQDLKLILFQIYVRPIPYEKNNLREIENYSKKEKSIGIPVMIDDDNFFNLSDVERKNEVYKIILDKLDLLKPKIKRNKLDFNVDKLKVDIEKIFNNKVTSSQHRTELNYKYF